MSLISTPPANPVDRQDVISACLVEVNQGWRNFFVAVYNLLSALTQNGTTAQRPTKFLFIGRPYWDTTLGQVIWWDGAAWVVNAGVSSSGTYTPTLTNAVNLDASGVLQAQYMRLGATVTVSGAFTADPTLTATVSSFELTLPVTSNIGATEDIAGVAFCGAIAGMGAQVSGVVATDTAKVAWISSDITNQTWGYTFTYQII